VSGVRTCFACKLSDTSLIQCAVQTCGRFSHMDCIGRVSGLGRRDSSSSARLVCSLHVCASCAAEAALKTVPKISKGIVHVCN